MQACEMQHEELKSVSSEMTPKELDRALRQAIENNNAEAVAGLLKKGASPNWTPPVVPKTGFAWVWSKIRLAEVKPVSTLHLAVQKRNLELVELLLSYGAFSESVDQERLTPIARAAMNGSWDIVKALIYPGLYHPTKKRDPFQYDAALYYALQGRKYDVARLLLEAGAPTDYESQEYFGYPMELSDFPEDIQAMLQCDYEQIIKQKKDTEAAARKRAIETEKKEALTSIIAAAKDHTPISILLGLLRMQRGLGVLKGTEEDLLSFYTYIDTLLAQPKTASSLQKFSDKIRHKARLISPALKKFYTKGEEKGPSDLEVKVNVALKIKAHAEPGSQLNQAMEMQLKGLIYLLLLEYQAQNEPKKMLLLLLEHGRFVAGELKNREHFSHLSHHIGVLINGDKLPEEVISHLNFASVDTGAVPESLVSKHVLLHQVKGLTVEGTSFDEDIQQSINIYWQQRYVATILAILNADQYSTVVTDKFVRYFNSIVSPTGSGLPQPLKAALASTPTEQKSLVVRGSDIGTLCKRLQHRLRDVTGNDKFGLFKQAVDEGATREEVRVPQTEEDTSELDFSFLPPAPPA